uniref:Fatty-acid-CoA ligase n=1 Tax=uncultured bacterium Contig248 TaxID=1393544 RepID=W0FNG2_9BACT|nr:fatty-acid-CoA ligase [uncultured bacterium Contig248]
MPDTRLHQGYGSSETGSICNCQYNAPGETLNSLGKPYPCVEVILENEDGSRITEPNREGYIRSRSGMNMLGYYKEPELTASVLKNGFIYSHDLMFFDERGELHFAGRGDDVINVRGFKVAPTEVENTALRFDQIADCVCLPFDALMGKELKLFVVMKEGEEFDPVGITAFLESRLEPYKVPKYIESIREIPRTYNGKIDRKALLK